MAKFVLDKVENIMGKEENAGNQHFVLFPQCFQTAFSSGSLKVGIVCGKELKGHSLISAEPCVWASNIITEFQISGSGGILNLQLLFQTLYCGYSLDCLVEMILMSTHNIGIDIRFLIFCILKLPYALII